MRIFIDIDGVMTDLPTKKWGNPVERVIDKVKFLIKANNEVVIWSGGGTKYCKEFCEKYGIVGAICIGKPHLIVDDNPNIRPKGRMPIIGPKEFLKMP